MACHHSQPSLLFREIGSKNRTFSLFFPFAGTGPSVFHTVPAVPVLLTDSPCARLLSKSSILVLLINENY